MLKNLTIPKQCEILIGMTPQELDNIYKFISTPKEDGTIPSLEEARSALLPDTKKYDGMVLCKFSLDVYSGKWHGWGLLTTEEYIFWDNSRVTVYLGSICGKHSEYEANWVQMFKGCIEDPYEINSYIEREGKISNCITQTLEYAMEKATNDF